MSDFEIPKRVSLDDIKDILKAYYIEGAHQEAVSTEAIKATADMGDKVGRQTNFLSQVGLIKKEGHDRRLTDDGGDISEALMSGNESLAKSLLREVFNEWEFTEKIRGFVRMKEPEPVEEGRIMEYLSANANSSDRRGRQSLLDLLVWIKILEEADDGYTISDGNSEKKTQANEGNENISEKAGEERPDMAENIPDMKPSEVQHSASTGAKLNVQIEISPADDTEDIEAVIMAARSALESDIDNENKE